MRCTTRQIPPLISLFAKNSTVCARHEKRYNEQPNSRRKSCACTQHRGIFIKFALRLIAHCVYVSSERNAKAGRRKNNNTPLAFPAEFRVKLTLWVMSERQRGVRPGLNLITRNTPSAIWNSARGARLEAAVLTTCENGAKWSRGFAPGGVGRKKSCFICRRERRRFIVSAYEMRRYGAKMMYLHGVMRVAAYSFTRVWIMHNSEGARWRHWGGFFLFFCADSFSFHKENSIFLKDASSVISFI